MRSAAFFLLGFSLLVLLSFLLALNIWMVKGNQEGSERTGFVLLAACCNPICTPDVFNDFMYVLCFVM